MTLGGNKSIAFHFTGTGALLQMYPANANLYMAVHKASDYELALYTYGTGKTMLYAKKRDDDATGPVKTAYVNFAPDPDTPADEVIEYGLTGLEYDDYLIIVTKRTGPESMEIIGVRVLDDEAKESEEQ